MGETGPGNNTLAAAGNKVRRGDIRQAIIVRTKKKVQRKDGMVVKFEDNACALVGKNGEPIGTRINGMYNWRGINVNMTVLNATIRYRWC